MLGLLLFGDYTRKERVSGTLVPDAGLIDVFAPQQSVVTDVRVQDGDVVEEGDPLFVLSTELESAAIGATQKAVADGIKTRRASLVAERDLKRESASRAERSLKNRLEALRDTQEIRAREISVQAERVELAAKTLGRLLPLRKGGVVTEQRVEQVEDQWLSQLARLSTLEREVSQSRREQLQLEGELDALPLKLETDLAALERNIAMLDQQLAEAESRRQIFVPAPKSGTITALRIKIGASAPPGQALLSIIPSDSKLEAKMYVPSAARGFINPGQDVLLRYHSFPFQKFGQYEGTIASVARSTIEVPLAVPSSTTKSAERGQQSAHVYPVTVRLAEQAVTAYGEKIPLQPGMQFQADIKIENRRLIEWMFEPLFTLTGGR